MNILLATSEVLPWSKTGGLADMTGALVKYLARAGDTVSVLTPLYRNIPASELALTKFRFRLPLGDASVECRLLKAQPEKRLTFYFVDQPAFYHRASLYQENGESYPDNAERFIYFSKVVAAFAERANPAPDVVHLHDWQSALAALFLHHRKRTQADASPVKTCFTIHNLAYQGIFPAEAYRLTNLPSEYFGVDGVEFYGQFNCMKAGLSYADKITTVSPRYAREVTTELFGCGLDGLLRKRQKDLIGILNGVDYHEWNTDKNRHLSHAFSATELAGKARQKVSLQAELALPVKPGVPLFGTIARLTDQKGVDILLSALEEVLASSVQFVLLGSGDPHFENAFQRLALRYPEKVAVRIGYDAGLAHRIEAGCDFYLMPSRFEPCGLNQMYSLRYGTVPVVRATGGLDDSVVDATEDADRANGIKFYEYSARALVKGIRKALAVYGSEEVLEHYRLNGMERNFGWERTAAAYQGVYQELARMALE